MIKINIHSSCPCMNYATGMQTLLASPTLIKKILNNYVRLSITSNFISKIFL